MLVPPRRAARSIPVVALLAALPLVAQPPAGRDTGVVDFSRGRADSACQPGACFSFKIDEHATLVPGTLTIAYPDSLRAQPLAGVVRLEFIVDTLGRVRDGSLRVLASSHPLFLQAVRAGLATARFTPARVGGRKVMQRVEMPFEFAPPPAPAAPPAAGTRARPAPPAPRPG
jgi:TonB family protein